MAKYRKKPVVIEAFQFLKQHSNTDKRVPMWFVDAVNSGAIQLLNDYAGHAIQISTLEGVMRGDLNDWIICGVKGEIYPCKPDVFEATYEAVDDLVGQAKT